MTGSKGWARMCSLALFGLLPMLLGGCAQVRLLRDTPEGGVVSIANNTNEWPTYYRDRAEELMRKKCPEGYAIISEKVVEDNPAAYDGRKPNEDFDYEGGYIRLTTYNRKEYHITFRSTAAPAIAPSGTPRAPKQDEAKDELPPPRALPSEPRP